MLARGEAAFSAAIRFASASIIRCRSAHLVAVRSNHRLPPVPTMRRAPAMPLFRTQSAAVLPSLAPHDSKARLQNGYESQGFMAKPCTPHPIAQRMQLFKIETANANAFLLDGRRPFSFHGKKLGVAFVQRLRRCFPAAQVPRSPLHLCGERSILWNIQ